MGLRKLIDKQLFTGLPEPLVVHSGLGGLRGLMPIRDVPKAVCDALHGLAVVMPAYTFQFPKTGVFDIKRSKPSTGAICEWFSTVATRTHKPLNSYYFTNLAIHAPQTTAWGKDGMMGWLLENDATFVSLGVSTLKSCSYFHYAEEKLKVPYRYFKTFKGMLYNDGKHVGPCEETLFVGPRGVEYDFKAGPAINYLDANGLIERRPHMEIIKVRDIVDAAEVMLHFDPYSLCHPTQEGRDKVREYVESGKLDDERR